MHKQNGATALHLVSELGLLDGILLGVDGFCSGHVAIVELLLKEGAEKNAKNSLGETPLHSASMNGQLDIMEVLLKFGVDKVSG